MITDEGNRMSRTKNSIENIKYSLIGHRYDNLTFWSKRYLYII